MALSSTLPRLVGLVFVEGFVSVSLEVLTLRQVVPFVGSSVVVTSLVIGFFLLFLALGYQRGGRRRGEAQRILVRNFLLAGLWLGVGLSYPGLEWIFTTLRGLGELGALIGYLLLVTSPLAYWLGQTVPMAAGLFPGREVRHISGQVLFLSTLGSFLGSVLTSLLLMNWLGVGATVFVDLLLLGGLVLLVAPEPKPALALVPLVAMGWWLNVDYNRQVFVADNLYGNYRVIQRGQARDLVVNNSRSSHIGPAGEGFWYIETIRRLLFDQLGLRERQILVLGAGGFTLAREGDSSHYTFVDIDGEIDDIVRKHFNPHIHGEFVARDARIYVLESRRQFDVIVSDVYLNRNAVPDHLLTVEHFRAVRARLKEGGFAVFNTIINPLMSDPYSRRLDNTLGAVFDHCMIIPRLYQDWTTNVIYACRDLPKDATVYRDDLNRAGLDREFLR